jgi:hypothetical protein
LSEVGHCPRAFLQSWTRSYQNAEAEGRESSLTGPQSKSFGLAALTGPVDLSGDIQE